MPEKQNSGVIIHEIDLKYMHALNKLKTIIPVSKDFMSVLHLKVKWQDGTYHRFEYSIPFTDLAILFGTFGL